MKAFKFLFKNYNELSLHTLLQEYNEQKTEEAKFVKQIDKLEMALQALEYEQQGWPKKDLDEFWANSEKYLADTPLEPIFRELEKIRG